MDPTRRLRSRPDFEARVTAAVAVVVAVLSILGVVGSGVVSAATLAVLALVALHLVGGRPAAAASIVTVDGIVVPDIDRAMDIRIVGVTLNRTLRSQLPQLERRLAAGASVRIAIIDPVGGAPAEAARRSAVATEDGVFEHRLQPTIDLLGRLSVWPGLEVRLLPFVPAFGLFMVDPDSGHGAIVAEVYSHHVSGPELWIHPHADTDPQVYRHCAAEFERVWASGRPLAPDAALRKPA